MEFSSRLVDFIKMESLKQSARLENCEAFQSVYVPHNSCNFAGKDLKRQRRLERSSMGEFESYNGEGTGRYAPSL